MEKTYVVTGGGRGIGRAVVDQLLESGAGIVVLDADPETRWDVKGVTVVPGDAADEAVAERAAHAAERMGPLAGWVNNAAVFRDASLHEQPVSAIRDLIAANLNPVLAGCTVAVRHLLAAGTPGSIVNLSSHQARRAVPGALPYSTAKAAIEGLTRALAVDYGPYGIRVNAVAPGSVMTERYADHLSGMSAEDGEWTEREMARLHPMGRVATAAEVASVIVALLSDRTSFVTGATIPVDGGRSVLAHDPQARIV